MKLDPSLLVFLSFGGLITSKPVLLSGGVATSSSLATLGRHSRDVLNKRVDRFEHVAPEHAITSQNPPDVLFKRSPGGKQSTVNTTPSNHGPSSSGTTTPPLLRQSVQGQPVQAQPALSRFRFANDDHTRQYRSDVGEKRALTRLQQACLQSQAWDCHQGEVSVRRLHGLKDLHFDVVSGLGRDIKGATSLLLHNGLGYPVIPEKTDRKMWKKWKKSGESEFYNSFVDSSEIQRMSENH